MDVLMLYAMLSSNVEDSDRGRYWKPIVFARELVGTGKASRPMLGEFSDSPKDRDGLFPRTLLRKPSHCLAMVAYLLLDPLDPTNPSRRSALVFQEKLSDTSYCHPVSSLHLENHFFLFDLALGFVVAFGLERAATASRHAALCSGHSCS